MGRTLSRRSVLTSTGGLALGGLGLSATTDRTRATSSADSFTLMEGTEHETTRYVQTGPADGPTVLVVGGMHGNEVAGYRAASKVDDLSIDRGRLVTIPRTNAVAIEDDSRYGPGGVDLNRQFPVGAEPRTELARALWDVVTRFEPDVVIDLHESKGVYDGRVAGGVGQAIFYSNDPSARTDAQTTADYLNAYHVDDSALDFTTAPFSDDDGELSGLFAHKAARDTDAVAYLAETVFTDVELATRIQWHVQIVRRLTDDALFDDSG